MGVVIWEVPIFTKAWSIKGVYLVTCLFVVLTSLGCTSLPRYSDVKNTSVRIHVSENPQLKTAGIAYMADTECAIVLKQYPVCLEHEIRHCLEGKWHEGESSEGCF